MRSAIYTGSLMHARTKPADNRFRYPVCFYVLDLDEVEELDRRLALFSYNGRNVVTLADSDHMGDPRRPIKENVLAWLAERGVDLAGGRILMLTNLRTLGYLFNPVSYFYCHRADGGLACVVAEVSNTFGERHCYLLSRENQVSGAPRLAYRTPKLMHVSPFFGMEQEYEFSFTEPGERVYAGVSLFEGGERPFYAGLKGRRVEIGNAAFVRALARYPLMPWQVIGLIHWQALQLWRKGVPLHRKPAFRPGVGSVAVAAAEPTAPPAPAAPRRGLRPSPPARRSLATPLVRRAAVWALSRPERGEIRMRMPDGTTHRWGDPATGPSVTMTVNSRDLFRRVARRGRLGIGEAYVEGDWDADDLPALLGLLARTAEDLRRRPPASALVRLLEMRPHWVPRIPRPQARRDIEYHYDLGNDVYRLFLDETLTYSCAYFEHEDQDLADAQTAKYRRMAEKLGLTPDDHVLEIGCGWGGFALHAAGEWGARVTGVTLSQEQHDLARERVASAGLADRVDIRLVDYREVTGTFTKIASIEMLEAVGERGLDEFFAACERLLARDGRACVQTIAVPEQRFERFRRGDDWIREYIFPGSLIPSLKAVVDAMARSSDLVVHGVENIGIGYADTLARWRAAFLANAGRVRELGFDERFLRGWEFYLAFCEAGFRTRALHDYQIVLTRPFNDALPPLPATRPTF